MSKKINKIIDVASKVVFSIITLLLIGGQIIGILFIFGFILQFFDIVNFGGWFRTNILIWIILDIYSLICWMLVIWVYHGDKLIKKKEKNKETGG
jgi:hypothetical protein